MLLYDRYDHTAAAVYLQTLCVTAIGMLLCFHPHNMPTSYDLHGKGRYTRCWNFTPGRPGTFRQEYFGYLYLT